MGFRVCNKTVYCGHHTLLPEDHPLRAAIAVQNHEARSQLPGTSQNEANKQSIAVPAERTHEQVAAGEQCCSAHAGVAAICGSVRALARFLCRLPVVRIIS